MSLQFQTLRLEQWMPSTSHGKAWLLTHSLSHLAAQGCTQTSITNVQDKSDCPRLADKTVVLGPSGDVSGHPKTTTTHMQPCQPNIPEPPYWSL